MAVSKAENSPAQVRKAVVKEVVLNAVHTSKFTFVSSNVGGVFAYYPILMSRRILSFDRASNLSVR